MKAIVHVNVWDNETGLAVHLIIEAFTFIFYTAYALCLMGCAGTNPS